MSLESMQESVEDAICRLLTTVSKSCLVTPEQMKQVGILIWLFPS